MEAKSFPLAVVASTYTGYMLCDSFSDVHQMIEHLIGDPVWTHRIPLASDSCKSEIRRQLPGLAGILDERLPALLKAFEEADAKDEPRKSWIQTWIQTLLIVDGVALDYEIASTSKGGE